MTQRPQEVAVLASGGIDSAVLCIDLLDRFERVHPIFVRFGLRWEAEELAGLRGFLGREARAGLSPLAVLDQPVADVYGDHWSLGGREVPDRTAPDEAVHLPGRNILLIAKAAVYCQIRGIGTVAMGSLAANPFPDCSPEFDRTMETVLDLGLGSPIRLLRPFGRLSKVDVLRRGAGMSLGLTVSCLDPTDGVHCGACNKCEERRKAFRAAGLADPTVYVEPSPPIRRKGTHVPRHA
jgi:7-cyano-7-deazaguanine synthase